jgi:hypothetical protein
MFVNIPSRIVEIQQYFVAIYPYFLNFFSVCLISVRVHVFSCHLKSCFFRLNVEILTEFVFRLFEPFD